MRLLVLYPHSKSLLGLPRRGKKVIDKRVKAEKDKLEQQIRSFLIQLHRTYAASILFGTSLPPSLRTRHLQFFFDLIQGFPLLRHLLYSTTEPITTCVDR